MYPLEDTSDVVLFYFVHYFSRKTNQIRIHILQKYGYFLSNCGAIFSFSSLSSDLLKLCGEVKPKSKVGCTMMMIIIHTSTAPSGECSCFALEILMNEHMQKVNWCTFMWFVCNMLLCDTPLWEAMIKMYFSNILWLNFYCFRMRYVLSITSTPNWSRFVV